MDCRAADVGEELAIGEPVAAVDDTRAAIGIDHQEVVVAAERRHVRSEYAVGMGEFAVQRDVAAAVGKVLAVHRRNVFVAGEALFSDPALAADLKAAVVLLQDEVDHARDRVGAVDRRIAAGDDINAFNQVARDRANVRRNGVVENVRRNVAAAIDQHQRARSAEPAQIEQAEAGDADAQARVLLGESAAQLRQVVERIADIVLALLEKVLADNRSDRHGRFQVRALDARTGNHDCRALLVGVANAVAVRIGAVGGGGRSGCLRSSGGRIAQTAKRNCQRSGFKAECRFPERLHFSGPLGTSRRGNTRRGNGPGRGAENNDFATWRGFAPAILLDRRSASDCRKLPAMQTVKGTSESFVRVVAIRQQFATGSRLTASHRHSGAA